MVNSIGDTVVADGQFAVSAGGADISGVADSFRFVWQPLVGGTGGILARVATVSGSGGADVWAKAGLMVREDFTGGARNALLRVTHGGNTRLHWRAAEGGDTDGGVTFTGGAPRWLYLEQDGVTTRGYDSADGENWRFVGSVDLGLSGTVYLGLAATSHNNNALTVAVFDNIEVTLPSAGGGEEEIFAAEFDTVSVTIGAGGTEINWSGNFTNVSGFTIQRSDDQGQTWQTLTMTNTAARSVVLQNQTDNAGSVYRVVASGAGAGSAASGSSQGALAPTADYDGDGVPNADDAYPTDPRRHRDVPPLTLAAIDISGTAIAYDIKDLALDDSGSVAFIYKTGSTQIISRTWANGQLNSTTNTATMPSEPNIALSHTFNPLSLYGETVNSAGDIYGNIVYRHAELDWTISIGFVSQNSDFNYIPIFGQYPDGLNGLMVPGTSCDVLNVMQVQGNSHTGQIFRSIFWPEDYFVYHNGITTVFTNNPHEMTASNTLKIVAVPGGGSFLAFLPLCLNDNGWVAGAVSNNDEWNASGGCQLWNNDEEQFYMLDGGPAGINNQGQVVGDNAAGTGYLWQSGETETIISLLPEEYQQQIRNIHPKFISNADADGAVRILFKAETLEGAEGDWVPGEFILKTTVGGSDSTLHQLKRSEDWTNYQDQYLNNSGIIATLAKPADGGDNNHALLLMPIEINHADGDEIDQPMKYIPQWFPNDGVGKGEPVFDTPTPVFTMQSIGATMQISLLGSQYLLNRNTNNLLLYENSNMGVSVLLNQEPLADTNVLETLTASVSMPLQEIQNSRYICDETEADSAVFQNTHVGIVMTLSDLTPASKDTMNIRIYHNNSVGEFTLQETDNATKVFSNEHIMVKIIDVPVIHGIIDLAITYDNDLSDTVLRTQWNGTEYRNFAAPVSTDLPAEQVPDFAAFYIQIPACLSGSDGIPTITLSAMLNGEEQEIAEVEMESAAGGKLRSVKKLVLLGEGANASQMADDKDDFQTIQWPEGAEMDWTQGGGKLLVAYQGVPIGISVEASGVALQSLDFKTKFGQGLDIKNRVCKPFEKMGYTMYRDYNAKVSQTLNDYVKNKQIWYSMSHGGTENGKPTSPFTGLIFVDGAIRASNLQPLSLNYRLVIVDGCCSAQTDYTSQFMAEINDILASQNQLFADAFGPKTAYVGWSWEELPSVQVWTGEFISYLKGGRTVREAHGLFRKNHNGEKPGYKELKIYGKVDDIIDLNIQK
ncbi:MAG: hypothetical protein LBK60_04860 [Verrucomicrobiales bacterium]|nr:hypothetical protein [Verrucomicrobiales bacterium]